MNFKEKTIAVLPFVNMSPSVDNEFFSDGITEEIINALAKIDGIKVTSRTSAFFFKGKKLPITEVGRQLNVGTILEGSVRLSGNAMRITAQLIQAKGDFHFWSETWDRKLDNIFEVQDEISLLIAEKLREHFGHFEIHEHLVTRQTDSLDAYTFFLKGRYYFNKWNPEDIKTAITCYQQAIDLDPYHPNSLVGLADCYSFLATCGFISFAEGWSKCAELTNKALSINSQLPFAYYQLANYEFFVTTNFRKAFQLIEKAIEINPNHVESLQFMSFLCILAGQDEKAGTYLRSAITIDPLSQETQFYSAYLDYMLRHFDSALVKLDRCLEVNPKNIPAHTVKALCLLMLARYNDAIDYVANLPSDIIIEGEKTGTQALAYALQKNKSKAKELLEQLHTIAATPQGFTADSYLLLVYAATGQNDLAFNWIENAINNNSPLVRLRFSDPVASPLKGDTRYHSFHQQLYPEDLFTLKEDKKKPLLDTHTSNQLKDRLLQYIESEQPYLQPDLTLRSLARLIDVHPNQLSWILNESIGKNFNDFINHFRVKAFKRIAKDPSKANLTLISMAYESGFNSKTVFNTYFKKETGITPKQFLSA